MRHPARLVPLMFLVAIAIGTLLLMVPAARAGGDAAPLLTALFTATSAVCVTGLIVVDTPVYWTGFGQTVILGLFQVGGFGLMTAATLLGLLVSRSLGLRQRLAVQRERATMDLGDVTGVLKLVFLVTISVEAVMALALAARLHIGYGEPWPAALWHGLFHSVSAFNNAGFSTYSDSLMGFESDPLFLFPIILAVMLGGLGFPVLYELRRWPRREGRWSVHTKLTLLGTGVLLVFGFVASLAYEWNNPRTLGPLGIGAKLLGAFFHSVIVRTAGFNTLDVGSMQTETLTLTCLLMFIGGGSASTAGGIKVTTFFLLAFVVWAEMRNNKDTTLFSRRVSLAVQRQALTVVLLMVGIIVIGTQLLLTLTELDLRDVLFEVISASATVGLSTGITAKLPPAAQVVVIVLMFVGRVGPVTLAAALALQERGRLYRYPEEVPIVG